MPFIEKFNRRERRKWKNGKWQNECKKRQTTHSTMEYHARYEFMVQNNTNWQAQPFQLVYSTLSLSCLLKESVRTNRSNNQQVSSLPSAFNHSTSTHISFEQLKVITTNVKLYKQEIIRTSVLHHQLVTHKSQVLHTCFFFCFFLGGVAACYSSDAA